MKTQPILSNIKIANNIQTDIFIKKILKNIELCHITSPKFKISKSAQITIMAFKPTLTRPLFSPEPCIKVINFNLFADKKPGSKAEKEAFQQRRLHSADPKSTAELPAGRLVSHLKRRLPASKILFC